MSRNARAVDGDPGRARLEATTPTLPEAIIAQMEATMYVEPLHIEILEVLASMGAGVAIVAAMLAGCWAIGKAVDRD